MGSCLPSAGEVLIIPPTGKMGQPPQRFSRVIPPFPGPARKPGIPEQDPDAMRSMRNAVAAQSLRTRYPEMSREFQGAILMKTILLSVVLGVAVIAVGRN